MPDRLPRQAGTQQGARQRAQGKPDGEPLRRCVRQIGTARRAVAVRLMADRPAADRDGERLPPVRPAECPARSARRTVSAVVRTCPQIGTPARLPRQAVRRRDRARGARLPDRLPRQAGTPAPVGRSPAHLPRQAGTPQGERHGAQAARRDRERANPSGTRERKGGRLPLRSWRNVRRTVATASRPARSGTAHRVRTRHRPAMCPHRVRLMADRPADGGEIGTPAPLPRRTVAG